MVQVESVVLCGVEAHACIQATALDFLHRGYRVDTVEAHACIQATALDFLLRGYREGRGPFLYSGQRML